MISTALLFWAALSPFLVFGVHGVMLRFFGMRERMSSPQLFLIGLVLFLNLPMEAGVCWIAWHEHREYQEWVWMLVFMGVVFNGLSYAYFHFFNMSETSRRIRLLILVREGASTDAAIHAHYSTDEMIRLRVERLEAMRQIVCDKEGRYRVSGRFFLTVALAIRQWRRCLGMEKNFA